MKKEKVVRGIKLALVMIVLFVMAYAEVFPTYWRTACGIWFAILAISALNEIYNTVKG